MALRPVPEMLSRNRGSYRLCKGTTATKVVAKFCNLLQGEKGETNSFIVVLYSAHYAENSYTSRSIAIKHRRCDQIIP